METLKFRPNRLELLQEFLVMARPLLDANKPLDPLFGKDFPPKLRDLLIEKAHTIYELFQRKNRLESWKNLIFKDNLYIAKHSTKPPLKLNYYDAVIWLTSVKDYPGTVAIKIAEYIWLSLDSTQYSAKLISQNELSDYCFKLQKEYLETIRRS